MSYFSKILLCESDEVDKDILTTMVRKRVFGRKLSFYINLLRDKGWQQLKRRVNLTHQSSFRQLLDVIFLSKVGLPIKGTLYKSLTSHFEKVPY